MRAPLPASETVRLDALRQYEVLDTLPEPAFDELTQLASQICDTPIALISLIDAERQWFKSRVGLDAVETHRDLAFCAHAILQDQPLVVVNATEDKRFWDNPLVLSDPKIRFYLGSPLVNPAGHALGTLCVIDRVPRQPTDQQIRAITVLGHQVVSQLELRARLRMTVGLVTELESTRHELERRNADLERFTSVAAHDLKEPVRKVELFSERLATLCGNRLSQQERKCLASISRAGQRMHRLIVDLLAFARLTTNERTFQPVDLMAVARDVVSDLEARIEQTGGRVTLDDLPRLEADPTQIRQLFQNLIGNALKFHHKGVRPDVRIRCEVVADSNGSVGDPPRCYRISVIDNGIGFDQTYADRIFEPFQRLHGAHAYDGSGIGLAVCMRVVAHHAGTITAHSKLGEGSTFVITLPSEQTDAPGLAA